MIVRRAILMVGLLTLVLLAGVCQSFWAPAAVAHAAVRNFTITFLRKEYHFNKETLPSLLETHPAN
ncbi:MAG: hypothetical protein ACRD1Y_03675, partial [Terriglobales bacterium]